MENLVDIIIPNFNKGKYLDQTIKSVINQTFTKWKIYLIDDNSNDNSKEILEQYKKNSKIYLVFLKKNMGPSFCRNLGIRLSSSKYISFLDSDDFWTKNKLDEQIKFMEQKKIDFSYTDYISFYEKDKKLVYLKPTNITNYFNYNKFINNSSINSSTMIISRSILKNSRFKKLDLLEDYLFKCEIFKRGVSAYKFNLPSAYYRILRICILSLFE